MLYKLYTSCMYHYIVIYLLSISVWVDIALSWGISKSLWECNLQRSTKHQTKSETSETSTAKTWVAKQLGRSKLKKLAVTQKVTELLAALGFPSPSQRKWTADTASFSRGMAWSVAFFAKKKLVETCETCGVSISIITIRKDA